MIPRIRVFDETWFGKSYALPREIWCPASIREKMHRGHGCDPTSNLEVNVIIKKLKFKLGRGFQGIRNLKMIDRSH